MFMYGCERVQTIKKSMSNVSKGAESEWRGLDILTEVISGAKSAETVGIENDEQTRRTYFCRAQKNTGSGINKANYLDEVRRADEQNFMQDAATTT